MKILVLPGDCIGPEITAATLTVLEAVDRRFNLGLRIEHGLVGFASLEKAGSTLTDETLDAIGAADGTILGPVHSMAYPAPDKGGRNPSGGIRKTFDLYANIRPSKTRPGVPSTVKQMDMAFARENTEGFYADRTMFMGSGEFMPTPDLALAVRKITRQGSERIARAAFELAMRRRRKVTAVHKVNVLKQSEGLFLECCRAVAAEYPQVEYDEVLVDAMAAFLVRVPERFDVVVTTNMFGDILSDLCAELVGGLGVGGSINAGPAHCIAQAAHGAAPDIAGQNVANPTSLILSMGMLLDWLGARHDRPELAEAAIRVSDAIDAQLADAKGRTRDLGGPLGTEAFGKAVAARVAGGA